MNAAIADPILDEMVRRIVAGFDPARIILFGSRGRGDHRPDSDYDLLVILDEVDHRRDIAVAVRGVLRHIGAAKDIVVLSLQESQEVQPYGRVTRDALREGLTIFER